jgi:GTPase
MSIQTYSHFNKKAIAIVGRPNAGKSTLFNALIRKRLAITTDIAGTTRDVVTSSMPDRNDLILLDTAGIDEVFEHEQEVASAAMEQTKESLQYADLILFVVVGGSFLSKEEEKMVDMLRKSEKEVIIVMNKSEKENVQRENNYFYTLGFSHYIETAAKYGRGILELREMIYDFFPDVQEEEKIANKEPVITFVGRPNVGKSSLLNAFLKKKEVTVTDIPGTTRDSIKRNITFQDTTYTFIDTAGVRRNAKRTTNIEKFSTIRTALAIEESDIALFVIDGSTGITRQDMRIGEMLQHTYKGIILLVNKWDLAPDYKNAMEAYVTHLQKHFSFLLFAPVLFTSAVQKTNLTEVYPIIENVMEQRKRKISKEQLDIILEKTLFLQTPKSPWRKRKPRIIGIRQSEIEPLNFICEVNEPKLFHTSFLRFLQRNIRDMCHFDGVNIRITLEKRVKEL